MAEFLDKDPYSYDKERQAFISELRQFLMRLGSPLLRLPNIAGRKLDLYLLYKKVIALGGLAKVTDDEQWEGILQAFKIPLGCCHGVFALRSFYVRYLEAYEKIHHQGEDAAEIMAAYKSNIPTGYMSGSNAISDKLRASVGLSTAKPLITDYDKLIHSLKSGLPNEADFAINVCTLLSNEGKHVIHLEQATPLIDLLLAHVGVFFEGPGSLRVLYEEDWSPVTKRNFVKYWYDTVEDKEVREVIGPEPLKPKGDMEYKDGELFCGRSQGLTDVEEQRITQISIILRNLSFEKHNKKAMAAHRTLYRFLLLCVHNSDSALKQLGMDTLSNLAADFVLDPIDYRSTQLMFHTIDKGTKDPDRQVVLRAMEVLQKLSKVRANLETIKMCLEPRVYLAIVQMLIVHDVQLLLGALEVLLALSTTGDIICTRIAKVDKCIDILVCLVTLDAQSLGAEAFVGIKIVDHAPDGIHHPIVTMARYQQGQQMPNRPAKPPQAVTQMSSVARSSERVATPPPPHRQQQQNSSSSSTTASRAAESENFASQWLHSIFQANPQGSVSRIDLYADYLSACSKMTRGAILNSNTFANIIKNVFPNVGFQRVEQPNGAQYHITGIQRRATPLPMRWQNQRQQAPPPVNYQMQVSNNQNTASNIIAHLARKHSPAINAAQSPSPRMNYAGNQATQQYLHRPSGNMMPNQGTGRPGLPPTHGSPTRYSGGLIQTTQPNQVPQTVLQRPPPSHMPTTNPLMSPQQSRSPSPYGTMSNQLTSQQVNPALSPALQRNIGSCNSPATVIIGGLPTEKCEPPSQIPLPDGEVRIQKVPNLYAQLLQQAHFKAQQQSTHPDLPLPLLQVQPAIEVPVAAPSPDGDTLPNPVGLQQQMQQAMLAASTVTAQPVAQSNNTQQPSPAQLGQPGSVPNNMQQPLAVATSSIMPQQVVAQSVAVPLTPQQPIVSQPVAIPNNTQQSLSLINNAHQSVAQATPVPSQTNHSTAPQSSLPAGTKQYVAIQPKPNMSVPSSSSTTTPQLQPQPATQQPQAVQVGVPQQNQMQVVMINRPAQAGSVQPQQPQSMANIPQQPGQINQFAQQGTAASLPNQFPRLAGQIPQDTSLSNVDSPLIKRLLQSGTAVQPQVGVSPPMRVSPSPQQQVVQSNCAAPMPNSSQYTGPNQTAQQVLPTQGSNLAAPAQTTQQQPQQTVVGGVNNTFMHTPSPPLPTVSEQLQHHRENQQQHVVASNMQRNSPQPNGNINHESNHVNTSQKTNGPSSVPVLNNQESTNGPKSERTATVGTEVPKCNGISDSHKNVSNNIEEKMEVDPQMVKPVSKPVDSLLKQHLVNGYASDGQIPIKNDVVVNRVEIQDTNESSGILEAALSIAGIEPDSGSQSSGKSTPVDPMLASGKSGELINHVLNGDILSKNLPPLVGDMNSNQGTKSSIVIIGNNGSIQDGNIPTSMATTTNMGKQVNQLILCRDIRENLPSNLHILPTNYNNNNPQQQQGTIITTAVPSQMTSSGSAQYVANPQQRQQVQISGTAVSRSNTVQVHQGAIITVQQPGASGGQTQIPMQMSTQQGQPMTFQLQQQSNVQTVNVQQPSGGVRQLVVQQPLGMQQQTLIVRPVGQQQQQQTMNIQVQNPNGQTGQQVIRLPVSIQGGQQQILQVQRPLQSGQQQTQQFIIVNNNQQTASSMPAPNSITAVKSPGNLKRPAPVDSPKLSKDSKVNNTVDGSSSTSSHHKEKKKKHHSSSKKRRKSSSGHRECSKKSKDKDKDKDKESEQQKTQAMVCMCEWKGCRRTYNSPKLLHIHAAKMHVMGASYRMMCEWEGCDHIQRQRWSCVSHILDKHCSQAAIKASNDRRNKLPPGSEFVSGGPTQPPIVYNAHNAYHAIRRSLHNPSLKDLLGETEGPVTKSIRLTASLVLKNLASRSSEARRLIRRHEVHLARLATSQAEASITLSKCIQELNAKS